MREDMKVIYGTIVDRNGQRYPRLGVQVLVGQKTLGHGQADADGGFEVAIPVAALKRAIAAYDRSALTVRAVRATTLVAESAPIAVEADTRSIRVDLQASRARPLEGEPRSRVSGTVRDERGAPVAGLEISVIDRDLRLGEVGGVVLGDRYAKLDGAQTGAAFLFASYLFASASVDSREG